MKNFFKTEWAKLKEMTFREKRQYIWEYYKLHIIGLVFAAFIIGNVLNIWVFNPPKQEYLYVVWLGEQIAPQRLQDLGDRLETILDNPERQRIVVTSYAASPVPMENMAIGTRFIGNLQLGLLDMILVPEEGLEELVAEGFIRPVQELLQKLEYLNPPLYDEIGRHVPTYAMAISVEGAPLLEELGIDSGGLYVAVVANTRKIYEIAKGLGVFFR